MQRVTYLCDSGTPISCAKLRRPESAKNLTKSAQSLLGSAQDLLGPATEFQTSAPVRSHVSKPSENKRSQALPDRELGYRLLARWILDFSAQLCVPRYGFIREIRVPRYEIIRGAGVSVPPSSQTLLPLGRTEPHPEQSSVWC